MINILGEINGLIQIYQEFLNFKDDQDLSNLIQNYLIDQQQQQPLLNY